MKHHAGAPTLAADAAGQSEPFSPHGGTLLGWYTTDQGHRRNVRAIGTDQEGLCVIDAAGEEAFLVEPRLEGMAQARVLAADYLALASERGEPQSRHRWPPGGRPHRWEPVVSARSANGAEAAGRVPAQRGDEAELFERYAERLVRVVGRLIAGRRHLTEDACSFAWLQLLRTQPERDSIFAWLCVVAINEGRRLLRAQTRHVEFDEDPAEPTLAHVERRADLELALEVREAFEQIAALTPQQVRIFSLHVAGLTYEEICAVTGYSWTQVNRHMGRARSRLRARRNL